MDLRYKLTSTRPHIPRCEKAKNSDRNYIHKSASSTYNEGFGLFCAHGEWAWLAELPGANPQLPGDAHPWALAFFNFFLFNDNS